MTLKSLIKKAKIFIENRFIAIVFCITFVLTVYFISTIKIPGTSEVKPGRFDASLTDTARLEIIKNLLELLLIVVVGGGIAFYFKQEEEKRKQLRIKEEEKRRSAIAIEEKRQKELQIQTETKIDYLKRLRQLYLGVKLTRRKLRAAGLTAAHEKTSITEEQYKLYKKQMKLINEKQLELEDLNAESGILPALKGLQIGNKIDAMENYLNKIVKEFGNNILRLQHNKNVNMEQLEHLKEFTFSTKEVFEFSDSKKDKGYRFKTQFSEPYYNIINIVTETFK